MLEGSVAWVVYGLGAVLAVGMGIAKWREIKRRSNKP